MLDEMKEKRGLLSLIFLIVAVMTAMLFICKGEAEGDWIYYDDGTPVHTGSDFRYQGVRFSLPEDVLAEIDRYAENHGLSRSGFLAHAAKRAIEETVE